jgi:hypothetical protein
MNVLCIYNHDEYVAPLIRSVKQFAEQGILLDLARATDEAAAERAYRRRACDVLLMQCRPVFGSLLDRGVPVILLERVDGAQLRRSRYYLPDVCGVIKSYLFRDRDQYNEINDRAHLEAMADLECKHPIRETGRPQPQLCDADLAKLRIGYSAFGCHEILKPCVTQPVDLDAERPIDVHFAGTVDYEGSEVDTHRRLALKAAEDWQHHGVAVAVAGRTIPRERYYEQIRQSKVVLCPWGWGESTYRDYEAMALGAVVLKPDTSHVESWPDIYRPENYVVCRPDFSDAIDTVRHIKAHWRDYAPQRSLGVTAVRYAWQPSSIARHMAKTIEELVA